jgi:hypothetical protein
MIWKNARTGLLAENADFDKPDEPERSSLNVLLLSARNRKKSISKM